MAFQLPMPCRNVSDCFPCNDLPTTNKSSEAQDVIEDFVIQWGNLQTNTPPLGSLFRANGCTVLCVSAVSQQDAFLCAQRSQALCVINNWQPDPPDPPICLSFPCSTGIPPTPPAPESFANQAEGCTANCDDGVGFTFTTAAGSFIAASQALADRMASSFACREAVLHRVCLSLIPPQICLDTESTITFIASGRFLSATSNFWEIRSGALPPGFSFSNTMAGPVLPITGTATASGDYSFRIRVTAPNGDFAERAYTVSVGGITTADPLPDADMGAAYSETLTSVGITGDLIWLIFDGDLPDGLTLDETTGEISGTPTETGDFEFTVSVSSATQGCEKLFHLTVGGCFIDASANLDLLWNHLSRSGPIASYLDNAALQPWYYSNRTFQQNALTLGGTFGQNLRGAVGRYLSGQEFAPDSIFWIDLDTATIRNIDPTGTNPTICINDSGDVGLVGAGSFIYNATSNTLTADLMPYSVFQIDNSRNSVGTQSVAGDQHVFFRTSAGVYTDLHLALGGGAGSTSNPGANSGQVSPCINTSGHVAGQWFSPVNARVFANFGGASIFLSGVLGGNASSVIINDSDQVAYDDGLSGNIFIYTAGVTTNIGALGVLTGFNNSGIAVGRNFAATSTWIYANGVSSTLISKIPSAAGDGWTSIEQVFGLSDDNFVAGIGTLNGVSTPFVAKVCV